MRAIKNFLIPFFCVAFAFITRRNTIMSFAQRLTAEQAPLSSDPAIGAGTVPYVIEWPPRESHDSIVQSTVPDVAGASLRDAARALHRAGLRMRVEGWGTVTRVNPPPGTRVAPGTLVTVTATERGRR